MFTWFINLNNNMQAIFACIFTWLFTVIGFLSVLLIKKIPIKVNKVILGFASGSLLASSIFSLLIPVLNKTNKLNYIIGMIFGMLFFYLITKISIFKNNSNNKLLLTFGVHNIPEGLIIGTTFASLNYKFITLNSIVGLLISIALQNIPDGIISAIPLKNAGLSVKKILFICFLISIIEPVSGILGIVIVNFINAILPFIFSISFGFLLCMLINELLPECATHSFLGSLFCIIGFIFTIIVN